MVAAFDTELVTAPVFSQLTYDNASFVRLRYVQKIGQKLATPATREKRAVPRYRLSLPVLLRWHNGEAHTCGGFTRDVSTKGVFVLCREKLPLNTTIQIEILLPTSGQLPGTALKTTAHVVRTYDENEGVGFAVEGPFGQSEFPSPSPK